jgi:hypothetical protein
MRKAGFLIVGILLLGVGVAVGWFAARRGMPTSEQNTTSGGPTNSPKFWSDNEAAAAIKSLGYDQAYLFRWQSGHVDGWVEFNGEGGPNRVKFDTRQASRPAGKPGGPLEPRRLSGFVVVAMRKLPSAEWEEYEVKVEQRFEYDMGSDERAGARALYTGVSQLGKVRTRSKKDLDGGKLRTASVTGNTSAALMKHVEGKSENWFELRLVSPSD